MSSRLAILLAASAALALTACGGGGGGSQVASLVPPPPVPPAPGPTPLPPAHIGLVSDKPFAALGTGDTFTSDATGGHIVPTSDPAFQNVQFRYDPASNGYLITVPGFSGSLGNTNYSGSSGQTATSTTSQITDLAMGFAQPAYVSLPVPGSSHSPYTYTSFATWSGDTGVNASGQHAKEEGIFVYGIPTLAGDVPVTGSATYSATIIASSGASINPPGGIGGDVSLSFNFGAGTLSGWMHPRISDDFDGIFVDYGQFDFKNTVYSTGSTTFSGQFVVPGLPNASSSFNGNFTGPNAAELMARFQTPFLLNGQQGTMAGIWIGKKN